MKNKVQKIDWEKARAQLARNGEALENALEADPDRVAEIFRQRARYLAARRRGISAGKGSADLQVQTFGLGEQRYGIELNALSRILPLAACTRIPGAPAEVLGLINLQGDIVAVFELALLLGLETEPDGGPGYLLLLKNGGRPVGLRVRELGAVQSVSPEDMEDHGVMDGLGGDCGRGITKDRLVILDEEKIGNKIQPDCRAEE